MHIADKYALADPLLARLPPSIELDLYWRVGHFKRRLPDGYLETASTGQNKITEKNVAIYYDKLALVTRGPFLDVNRWQEIWNLNTGQYDHVLADYPPMFQLTLSDTHHAETEGFPLDKKDDLTRYAGIQIDLDKEYHSKFLEIRLVHIGNKPINNKQGDYQFVYFKGDLAIADQVFRVPEQIPIDGLVETMEIPGQVIATGYDNIKIFPVRGENIHETIYAITYLRLLDDPDEGSKL